MRIASLRNALVFLSLSLSLASPSFADTTVCDDLFGRIKTRLEEAFGKQYKVGLVERRGHRFGEDESTPGVFLGFNEYGHSYLSVNGLRLDGKIFGLQEVRKIGALDPGILFRFQVDPEQAERIKKIVSRRNHHFSFTCVRSACTVLKNSGIKLPQSTVETFFLAPSFKRLLEDGAFDAKTGKPIQIDVYALRDTTIQDMYENLEERDQKMAKPYFLRAKLAATAVAGTVAAGALLTEDSPELIKESPEQSAYVYMETSKPTKE